ncbi:hypothetical protein [Vogesella sp. LIG4]|uniref:hypothetical protein n=1 Tax=Vogesella sp. LIG4 TaxID=1192162 RepID=UPI00081F908E|nr:hypothetical protein [Vogesella sp. LIG4]SCK07603.1 hypothetical protein PSELUDRAFT_0395 [Vogesella sp. LIG4]
MQTLKPRNPFAHAPQMKKGGAHQRGASGLRFGHKQALLAELDDWYQETHWHTAADGTQEADSNEQPGCGPVFSCLSRCVTHLPAPC